MKNKWISIRVSDQDYEKIQKLKNTKVKPSDLLYFALNNITKKDKAELSGEIRKVGNNINQLAMKANQNKMLYSKDIINATNELKELYLQIHQFINYEC